MMKNAQLTSKAPVNFTPLCDWISSKGWARFVCYNNERSWHLKVLNKRQRRPRDEEVSIYGWSNKKIVNAITNWLLLLLRLALPVLDWWTPTVSNCPMDKCISRISRITSQAKDKSDAKASEPHSAFVSSDACEDGNDNWLCARPAYVTACSCSLHLPLLVRWIGHERGKSVCFLPLGRLGRRGFDDDRWSARFVHDL